jgi:DNA mismatch repair ATPase MutL
MAKDTPRKKVAATPQKKDNAKKSEPVAAKTKPAEQKKNDEPKLKEKKNNKRKLEETEETKESVEAVEEKTEEPAQKKKKSAPTTTSDEKSTLVAQYVRVKSNVLMTTLTKTLKLDVAYVSISHTTNMLVL